LSSRRGHFKESHQRYKTPCTRSRDRCGQAFNTAAERRVWVRPARECMRHPFRSRARCGRLFVQLPIGAGFGLFRGGYRRFGRGFTASATLVWLSELGATTGADPNILPPRLRSPEAQRPAALLLRWWSARNLPPRSLSRCHITPRSAPRVAEDRSSSCGSPLL